MSSAQMQRPSRDAAIGAVVDGAARDVAVNGASARWAVNGGTAPPPTLDDVVGGPVSACREAGLAADCEERAAGVPAAATAPSPIDRNWGGGRRRGARPPPPARSPPPGTASSSGATSSSLSASWPCMSWWPRSSNRQTEEMGG